MCIFVCILMCQLPSCNLFTQHYIVLWRDTSSELWTPVFLFNLAIQSTSCFPVFLLQTILFPFDTINPLFSARPVGLTTSVSSWGKVIWLCCAGLYFNLGAIHVSYWFDNLGFILREILAAVYITTFLLGFPNLTMLSSCSAKNFWRHCRGDKVTLTEVFLLHHLQEFLAPWGRRRFPQGESFTSNLFILFLSCLVSS